MPGWLQNFREALGARQHRPLLWACLIFTVFGAANVAEPLDDSMRAVRNLFREQPAGGNLVLVLPDSRSDANSGEWSWTRPEVAALVHRLRLAGASRVAIARLLTERPGKDDALASELAKTPERSVIAMTFDVNPETGERKVILPPKDLNNVADVALVSNYYDPFGRVKEVPYAIEVGGRQYPSMAARLANIEGAVGQMAPIDYAISLRSIPLIPPPSLMKQNPSIDLRGKTVLIASAEAGMNAERGTRVASAYAHILGAETLLRGKPVVLGWIPPFIVAIILSALIWVGRRSLALSAIALGGLLFVLLPTVLEAHSIFVQTATALLLVITITGIRLYRSYRRAGARENGLTGLPNLASLKERTIGADEAVVVAKVANYAELVSVVTVHEQALAQQIVTRLNPGAGTSLFHGDGGVFAWIASAESIEGLGDHLDALHAFFLKPVTVGSWQVDVSLSFGVDMALRKDMATCFACALVAADEAVEHRQRWSFYDATRLDDAEWNVSLLGKLDSAIESGEVWVAYQPKIDVKSGKVDGFEALVRWTHPQRGSISPEQFISVAENHGRIDRLTYFVLDDALAMLAGLRAGRGKFSVAVNISARMFGRPDFLPQVRAALNRHGVEPSRLIMEITESAAAENEKDMLSCVAGLVKMGVQVSIDDYGTGYSTLEYLKKLKAQELKIDRSFIAGMDRNRSDFMLVKATIDLAHSLGHRVVAEGVETAETMEILSKLGCDVAQGFLIARPMTRQDVSEYIEKGQKRLAA